MKRIKAFGVARLGAFALVAAAMTCLTACGEEKPSWHADSKSMDEMAEEGRNIVQAIIMADSQGPYRGYAWPSDAAGRYSGRKPDNAPNMYQSFDSTADYFTEALYLKESDANRRERVKMLKEVEPVDLVAEGYTEATGTTITAENCAWRIATNARRAFGKTPVLVSRNVNVDVLCNTPADDVSVGAEELLLDIPPFGKEGCVIVYKDGSSATFFAGDVNMQNLVPGLGNSTLSDIRQGEDAFRFLP